MSMIKVTNLSFAYEGSAENVFSDVSFVLDTSWRLGFIGRNGRGKTTFLNILMEKYAYSGMITSSERFEYFPYQIEDEEDFMLDVLRRLLPGRQDWEIIRELSLLDMDEAALYQPFYLLSKGQQAKALIAAMFLKENCFLLIDEPTSHLDADSRERLSAYLKKKQGFILVSHDRTFLDGCVDHILAINKENIEVRRGNFTNWWQNKLQQDALETAQNTKLKKDISRLQQSARQKADWSAKTEKRKNGTTNSGNKLDKGYVGHKAAKMMKRASAIETRRKSALEECSALMKNIDSAENLQIRPLVYRSEILCSAANLSIQYADNPVVASVDFEIQRGSITAVKGKNGSGKSSILKLICGYDVPHTGKFWMGSGIRISYVPQSTDELSGTLAQYAEGKEIDYTRFLTLLRKMDFSRQLFDMRLESYSEGQKKKVLLAGSLCEEAHLYVWDEPLNYIDVISRMQIEELLRNADITMIFVEHDREFSSTLASETICI